MKLTLNKEYYEEILRFFSSHYKLKSFPQTNYYFDLPIKKNFLLKIHGINLRVRKKGKKFILTLKYRQNKRVSKLNEQMEVEHAITSAQFQQIKRNPKFFAQSKLLVPRRLRNILKRLELPDSHLRLVSESTTLRTPIPWALKNTLYRAELDYTQFKVNNKKYHHYEWEIEIEKEDEKIVLDSLKKFFKLMNIPMRHSTHGKSRISLLLTGSPSSIQLLLNNKILFRK